MKEILTPLNGFIGIYENALDNEWCDLIIKKYNENIHQQISRFEENKTHPLHKADHKISGFDILDDKILNTFRDKMYKELLLKYSLKYAGFESYLNNTQLIEFKIQKTSPGEGYHIWHHEWSDNDVCIKRVLAWTLYLNDIEEGGETEFLYQSCRIQPKKGTVCVFPSFFTHTHRGNPPLKKDKYIVTGWVSLKEVVPYSL